MDSEKKSESRQEQAAGHWLTLEGQKKLTLTGVKELLRLDESAVALRVGEQILVVRGEGLRLRQLAPQEGRVEILGRVELLGYEADGRSKRPLRRLLG